MGPWAPGIWVGAPVVFSDAADDTLALLAFTHWWLSIQGIRAAAREVVYAPPVVGPIWWDCGRPIVHASIRHGAFRP